MSHEFDTYAGQGPGYDGPLHAPHGAINPNDYADAHAYQLALGGQHAADEYAARSVGTQGPMGPRCPSCEPLPVFGASQAQWRRLIQQCAEHQRQADARIAGERVAYLRLPSVDEATFRRFLRGQAPHIVDGKTHHFYNWTGARVAPLLVEALDEVAPGGRRFAGTAVGLGSMALNSAYGHRSYFLALDGAVLTADEDSATDSFAERKVPYPPESLGPEQTAGARTRWTLYVRARPEDRFNSRSGTSLADERCISCREINDLPQLVREAREARERTKQREAEELAEARQDRRDIVKMVIYWILILAVVVAVVGGLVWASHAIPHR